MGRYIQKLCGIQTNGEFNKTCDWETACVKGHKTEDSLLILIHLGMVTTD